MSQDTPTAYLNTDKLANICPHRDMDDTWLGADSYKTSEGLNLIGSLVRARTAVCDKCNSLVLVEVERRYIR